MRRVLGETLVGPLAIRDVSPAYMRDAAEEGGHATVLVTELGPDERPGRPERLAVVTVQLADEDGDAVEAMVELEVAPAEAAQLCRALATVAGLEVS